MVNEDPATGCHGELCVSGSRVVWYEGLHPHNQTVRKVYSVESEILQAFWCQFREESVSPSGGELRREDQSLKCVCVREHSCLTFFMQTGAVHYIPLPFLVHQAWPISSGVLLERKVSPEGGSDGLPTLFTLLHPMDDFCPATFRRPTATATDITVVGFFTDPQLRVVSTCEDLPGPPVVVCHNSSSGRHSVWAVQTATSQDIPAHLSTPRHSGSTMATPQHPLSTSAPSQYAQLTPLAPLHTPVEMILSSRKYTPVQVPGEVDSYLTSAISPL